MWKIVVKALTWLIDAALVKTLVFTAIIALVGLLVPLALKFLGAFLNTSALSSAFANIPSGVWYFLDAFRLDVGAPLVISAFVAHFLIRRLPVIG